MSHHKSPISMVQLPYVASYCNVGQCKYNALPSLQKALLDSTTSSFLDAEVCTSQPLTNRFINLFQADISSLLHELGYGNGWSLANVCGCVWLCQTWCGEEERVIAIGCSDSWVLCPEVTLPWWSAEVTSWDFSPMTQESRKKQNVIREAYPNTLPW